MTELTLPADFKNGPCCGVVAVAVVAGISQAQAEKMLRAEMPSHRSRWTGGTNKDQRNKVLAKLGIKFTSKYVFTVVNGNLKRTTLAIYVREYTAPGRTYMLVTNHHVVTVRDGIVIDQRGPAPAAKHWAAKQRVRHVTEIL